MPALGTFNESSVDFTSQWTTSEMPIETNGFSIERILLVVALILIVGLIVALVSHCIQNRRKMKSYQKCRENEVESEDEKSEEVKMKPVIDEEEKHTLEDEVAE